MTTAIAIAEPVDAAYVPATLDPLDALVRYTQMLAVAKEFAEYICMTPMVPAIYQGKPKHATVAILHGAELGLNPLQSLQQIFTVHGMPAIYARTMVALLKAKGHRFKTVEAGPDRVIITGTSRDGRDTETSEWTIERADRAGYIPKLDPETGEYVKNSNGKQAGNTKYLTEPENMLWAKAAATVCRRLAPDVLLGISRTVEDLESEPEPIHVQSERVLPAEVLAASAPADPVAAVQTWTPPAEPAESSVKPESEQVTDSAKASPEVPTEKPSTRIQQRKIARLFNERGVEDDAVKLVAAGTFLGREITSADAITFDEAIRLLAHLEELPIALDSVAEATGDWASDRADLEGGEQQ
ncbi:MAG: hypothetical protein JWN03_1163 [Nocardia sp.]|uniref:hypothetical protein n=1 Tax=Nocardia sp. TaxID=1821 RepID=UPI002618484B|nr:hypothetical protein [Nocardia sp.]MCU1640888.1 hypothetical protein [Nocardia sp.]